MFVITRVPFPAESDHCVSSVLVPSQDGVILGGVEHGGAVGQGVTVLYREDSYDF